MDDIADLQAQMITLRVAVEGLWMSLLSSGPDPVADAARLKTQNIAALGDLQADTPEARAVHAAVLRHSEHLWGSIEWQLQQLHPQSKQ